MADLTDLTGLFASPAADALSGALVHFLWQGALIGLLLWMALKTVDERLAGVRYALACAALVAVLVSPIVTWAMLSGMTPTPAEATVGRSAAAMGVASGMPDGPEAGVDRSPGAVTIHAYSGYVPRPVRAVLVQAWALGVFILVVRLTGGWAYVRWSVGRFGRPASQEWQERFSRTKARMHVTGTVRLLTSMRPTAPHVLGWLRPIVVLPVSALTGLSIPHVEAILAHELAHVRRRDYLVNVLQSLVEALLFYHPCVWWVSRQVRAEREHCCDEAAAGASASVFAYARALTALEEMRATSPRWAVAATGGKLSTRIERLLGISPRRRPASPSINAAGALLLVLATGVAIASCSDLATTPAPEFGVEAIEMELPPSQTEMLERGNLGALIESLHLLRSSGDEDALPIALSAYSHADSPDFRESIVYVLSYFFTEDADVQLGRIARSDPSADVRYHAVCAFTFRLSELGLRNPGELTPQDLPVLEARRARNRHYNVHMIPLFETIASDTKEEPRVRGAAIRALTATNYSDVSFLESVLESSEPLVRKSAIGALSHLGEAGFAAVAGAAEADPDPGVRRSAIWRLRVVGEAKAVPIVARFARTTDDAEERWAAVGTLTQLAYQDVPWAKTALEELEASGIPTDEW